MGIGRDEAASSRIFGRLASVAIGKPSNSVTKPHGRSPRGAAPAGSAWGTRGRTSAVRRLPPHCPGRGGRPEALGCGGRRHGANFLC